MSYDNKKKDNIMIQFQGFKPEAQKRIAGTLGYNGDMSKFDSFLEQILKLNKRWTRIVNKL